ncbi:hypothetical protein [Pectobacterium versatile]|uniref:hypothetical protein n=1 Tax=Pectobacterium versatile TaxID=2488639 RepID=UPI001FFDA261|nr:hypothetical protein [Pectobacterium versatile]
MKRTTLTAKLATAALVAAFFVVAIHDDISHMNVQIENAIRCVAKDCRAEIKRAKKCHPISEHDAITTRILDHHAKRITALPPGTFSAKRWLSYFVRVVDAEANK